MALEQRVSRLEGVLEQINERLGALERDVRDLRAEMRGQFRWMVGLMVVQWVTLLGAVVGALLAR